MISSISSIIQACLKELGHIIASQELEKYRSEVLPDLWSDELGRLRVWTANIGAHQTDQSSLDYRLRDASHLKDQTLRVLGRLQRTIQDLQDVLHETDLQDDFSSDLDDSEDEDQTDIQKIFHSLRDTINILFNNSISIRRPAHHDRLLGIKQSDIAAFEPFDRQHVANKFPFLDIAIQQRLGLAISRRRATLRYRERHHLKLARGLNQLTHDGEDTKSMLFSETIATEFLQKTAEDFVELQSTFSQTSYAKTIMEGGEGMAVPPPPKESSTGDPFECPYCFFLLNIDNRHSWAKHVFHDLMPYICVFSDCRTPHRLFGGRHEWYTHLQIEHAVPNDVDIPINCPLCCLSVSSGKPLERHLGRHLQELALFALPKSGLDEDGESYTSTIYEENRFPESSGSHDNLETENPVYDTTDTPPAQKPASFVPPCPDPEEPPLARNIDDTKSLLVEDQTYHSSDRHRSSSKSRRGDPPKARQSHDSYYEYTGGYHPSTQIDHRSVEYLHYVPQRPPVQDIDSATHTTLYPGTVESIHVNHPGRSNRSNSYYSNSRPMSFHRMAPGMGSGMTSGMASPMYSQSSMHGYDQGPPQSNSAFMQNQYSSSPYAQSSYYAPSASEYGLQSDYPRDRSLSREPSRRQSASIYRAPPPPPPPPMGSGAYLPWHEEDMPLDRSSSREVRGRPSTSHQEQDEDYYRMPPPPPPPPMAKPKPRSTPQVHQVKRPERSEPRKSQTSGSRAMEREMDVDRDHERMDIADLRDALPVVTDRGRRRISRDASLLEKTHSLRDHRRSTSYHDERRSARVAVASSRRRKPAEYYYDAPSSTAGDPEDVEREIENYQAARPDPASTAALPLLQEALLPTQTFNRNGSESGSPKSWSNSSRGSGTGSRMEEDRNMTLTLNGLKIGFTQEAVAGKSINIPSGENGAVRLNIRSGPRQPKQYGNSPGSDYTGGSDRRELEDVRRPRDDRRSERASRGDSQSTYAGTTRYHH